VGSLLFVHAVRQAKILRCVSTRLFNPFFYLLIGIVGDGDQLGPLGTVATNRPIVPAPGDYDDGEIGGMIGRGNRSTRRKLASVPPCPPQTPHAAQTRTRAAAMGSQRLTAWATARPFQILALCKARHAYYNLSECFVVKQRWVLFQNCWMAFICADEWETSIYVQNWCFIFE
jgi:hypothetical protein